MLPDMMLEDNMRFSEQLVSLDHAVALERLDGDEELLKEVAGLFLEEYPTLMAEIAAALRAGNANRLERAAHSLKGSVANFGAEPAVQAALAVEKIGRSGNLTGAIEACNHLAAVMHQLHPCFEQLASA